MKKIFKLTGASKGWVETPLKALQKKNHRRTAKPAAVSGLE
jgi:hypothetical protein